MRCASGDISVDESVAQVNKVPAKYVTPNLCCVERAIFTARLAPRFWSGYRHPLCGGSLLMNAYPRPIDPAAMIPQPSLFDSRPDFGLR